MNLVLDIGNTRVKAGLFDENKLIKTIIGLKPDDLPSMVKAFNVSKAIYSSVGQNPRPFISNLEVSEIIELSYKLPLPITIDYETPETLGHDRIAGVCGAISLFGYQNTLIIDCGSCITYDVVTKDGTYLGGAISPGLNMRMEALHTFTAGLPLIKAKETVDMIGKSTEDSIQSGVVHGVTAEIENYIHRFSDVFQPLQVVMCGGDTYFFENKVKARIFAAPELVLRGLNRILQHNA